MKNYLKYLKVNPWKIAYLIFITLVVAGCSSQVIIYWGMYGLGVNILISVCIFIIWFIAAYQPYYEWKDSLKKLAQQEAYKDSLNK